MKVCSIEFLFSHGRRPRGHGNWLFSETDGSADWSKDSTFIEVNSLWSEARRVALAEAKQRGWDSIIVLP